MHDEAICGVKAELPLARLKQTVRPGQIEAEQKKHGTGVECTADNHQQLKRRGITIRQVANVE